MKFKWSPQRGPLRGAFVFLSASVPDPKRHARFLDGPLERALMLRVIDRRVDDAVQSLTAHVLDAGGRIVHGGHPKITLPLAAQASNWDVASGEKPPILIFQAKFFEHLPAPPGREQMHSAGTAEIRWVSPHLHEVAQRFQIPHSVIEGWLPSQAAGDAPRALSEALLALRITMLLDSHPVAAVCIGGMEGIEAEAHLYWELSKMQRIPPAQNVYVAGSTFGAAARLKGEGILVFDRPVLESFDASRAIGPSEETARRDIESRVSYDEVMGSLVAQIAQMRSE
jgi:hypothetical protein